MISHILVDIGKVFSFYVNCSDDTVCSQELAMMDLIKEQKMLTGHSKNEDMVFVPYDFYKDKPITLCRMERI